MAQVLMMREVGLVVVLPPPASLYRSWRVVLTTVSQSQWPMQLGVLSATPSSLLPVKKTVSNEIPHAQAIVHRVVSRCHLLVACHSMTQSNLHTNSGSSLCMYYCSECFPCHPISLPIVTDCSQTDNTAAVIGGVVAVVFIIATAGTVIVVLVLRYRRGDYSKKYCDLPCNQCCVLIKLCWLSPVQTCKSDSGDTS